MSKVQIEKPIKQNNELLERIAQQIEQHPEEFSMLSWDCGTTACIAGWAARLAGLPPIGEVLITALPSDLNLITELLGVGSVVCGWHHPLFLAKDWPEPFYSLYCDAVSEKQQANIAAARIRHFIATEGRE